MTMISLRSANARVFLKNSRHCDNRNVYNYHKVIIIAFADEIIAFADNFNRENIRFSLLKILESKVCSTLNY